MFPKARCQSDVGLRAHRGRNNLRKGRFALDDLQQVGGASELGLVPTTFLLLAQVLRASVKAAAAAASAPLLIRLNQLLVQLTGGRRKSQLTCSPPARLGDGRESRSGEAPSPADSRHHRGPSSARSAALFSLTCRCTLNTDSRDPATTVSNTRSLAGLPGKPPLRAGLGRAGPSCCASSGGVSSSCVNANRGHR